MKKDKRYRRGLRPLILLAGYERIAIPREQLETMLNLCRSLEISYWDPSADGEKAELSVYFFSAKKLKRQASVRGLSPETVKSGGLPVHILKHKGRLGIPAGVILAALLIFLSGSVVWDVRIDGEDRLIEEEVEEILAQCGLKIGTPKRRLDIDVIENRALILSDEISWISVNMIGTVAYVEIRELDSALREELPEAANLVADTGGRIVRFEDVRGNIAVKVGDAVGEGQLLVGGIYGDEENGFRYTAARGRVFAECDEVFSVTLPRKYQKKVYSGETKCEKYLIFFKNEIKIFGNSRNLPTNCDKIEGVEYLRAPDGHDLPIGIRTVTYREYTYEEAERSDEELSALAEYTLDAEINAALADGELLRVSTDFLLSDEGYTLTRKVRCIRNIAVSRRIDISLPK